MQLKHIKLSGFKSFVDPTKISFPTNMVGVVGPNGCGKSNVIDAVRWVLGELSAKNLRGDSMVDVIFNGSENRKASGQCSIELLFDNSSGKIGGEFASFNEVSIKREMTRDAQSNYFINNTKCRRKDVQDIFLGTGLSSYAIIEQGMVSRLVSSKPDELRAHLEEAAGVSKYKERRKETESRIKRTKENLSRVKDIKDEIGRLIKRLQNQAKAAEKYNLLKDEKLKLELDKAILFSMEAKNNRDGLQKKLDGLKRDLKIKNAESDTYQSQIDQYRTENESVLKEYEIKMICLAGFMKILSKNFIGKFKGKILNIHPSLLPKYKGLNTHQRVLNNNEKYSGCTVHFVNSKLDSGKIILQKKVKISKNETKNSLGKKVLALEHKLYRKAILKVFNR